MVANSPLNLVCLLYLTIAYCHRQHVTLVPEKTKLLMWCPMSKRLTSDLLKLGCPITIDSKTVDYCTSAEHVGVLRSVDGGNMPHILDRISAHRRALSSVLFSGAAKHHMSSPTATLQLERW